MWYCIVLICCNKWLTGLRNVCKEYGWSNEEDRFNEESRSITKKCYITIFLVVQFDVFDCFKVQRHVPKEEEVRRKRLIKIWELSSSYCHQVLVVVKEEQKDYIEPGFGDQ